ncbi:HlyD family secretion protein [Methylocella tundrae]|uniref:Undecaprenyl pyrophosphate phosphatase n=1 Tax=Methylocella tundrae TaxID=227605 RepID=A0A4U8Z2F0_METTU|nr:HlyD family secretion protein [Methylocella tundrae]WPP03475.1 HlyD family secretion protein [Methylocella tundrae]VFU09566.1 undecaprenyl pyrophosphate phosphatase [Methylocella tundrae]
MTSVFSLFLRFAVTAIMLIVAGLAGWELWGYYVDDPWTRDGRVRADVVAVAPDVSGLVTDVLVRDNQSVKKGDVLFKIDRDRFVLALQQAEAAVEGRRATLDQANSDLARYSQLSDNVVSKQKYEQVLATQQLADASYKQARAERDVAKLNLERSEVRASVNGSITNFDLRPGVYVTAGKGVFALVDSDSLHVEGYFEETKLPRIHVGDEVVVQLMGERTTLTGHVESIAGAIEDRERSAGATLVANVNPTFSWVRLAQRVPVRITLNAVPDSVRLLPGRTATVAVQSAAPPSRWASALQLLSRLNPRHFWNKNNV